MLNLYQLMSRFSSNLGRFNTRSRDLTVFDLVALWGSVQPDLCLSFLLDVHMSVVQDHDGHSHCNEEGCGSWQDT